MQLTSPTQKLRLALMILLLTGLATWLTACGSAASPERGVMQAPPVAPQQAEASKAARDAAPASASTGAGNTSADGQPVPLADYLARATQAQEKRVIIYTGNVALVVKDTEESVQAITKLVEAQGGYVSGSNVYQSGEVLRGTVSVRVPAERYPQVMEGLRGLAQRVESENASTQDVTEEFTDLQARKTNLERTETALQNLLSERERTGSTSDILEVYRELTDVRGQIEQIEGRLRYLANQSALSTITIELIPDVVYQPVNIGGWQPQGVAKEAVMALVAALQWVASLIIWLVIFILPLFILLLIPIVAFIMFIRFIWRRYRRPNSKPVAPKKAEPTE